MEKTKPAEEKGMGRAEDGSSSSKQMVAEAKMPEAEPEVKVVEEFALAEKQGATKGKESMEEEKQLGDGETQSGSREKKVTERSEQTAEKKVMERSVSKADNETSSSSWMQMVEVAKMLALALQAIDESSSAEPEERVEEGSELEDPAGPARRGAHLTKGKEESMGVDEERHDDSSSRVVDMRRILDDMERWMKPSIYRVPDWLKSMTKAEAYRPEVVSLGPFHHGEPSLQPMEEQKRRLMQRMVERSKKPHDMFVAAITKVADKLQEAYYGLDEGRWCGDHNTARFVEVMVTDGGFLLEFMTTVTRTGVLKAGYAPYDPIFSERSLFSLWPRIRSDMILIENQVPLLALQTLEAVRSGTSPSAADINELVTDFICSKREKIRSEGKLGLHTLEMFHRNFCYQPLKHKDELCHSETTMLCAEGVHFKSRLLHPFEMLHRKFCGGHFQPLEHQEELWQSETPMLSVEELVDAGVQFKRSHARSVQDIDFKNGVLSMPPLEIDDSSERTFLNLMAFERLHSTAGSVATAYMIFMCNIIDSEKDVALLRSKKVLKNFLSSDMAAAYLFSTLSRGAYLKPNSKVGHVQWLVAKHCERPWPKLQASFKQTYRAVAVATITIIVLTILQAVYTVMPFYTKN